MRGGWEPGCTRRSFDRADGRRRHALAPSTRSRSALWLRAGGRNRVNRRPAPRQPFRQGSAYRGIASRHQNASSRISLGSRNVHTSTRWRRGARCISPAGGASMRRAAGCGTATIFPRTRASTTRDSAADATSRSVIEPGFRIDQRWGLVVDFAEQRFDAAAKLARAARRMAIATPG